MSEQRVDIQTLWPIYADGVERVSMLSTVTLSDIEYVLQIVFSDIVASDVDLLLSGHYGSG